VDGDSG
jgi:hypothetical protein